MGLQDLMSFAAAVNHFMIKLANAIRMGWFIGKAIPNTDQYFYEFVKADPSHKGDVSCLQYTVNGSVMERFLKVDGRAEGKCIDQGFQYG